MLPTVQANVRERWKDSFPDLRDSGNLGSLEKNRE